MTTEHLDSSSLDALESLVISDGWLLIEGRVRQEIERKRDALEQTPVNLHGPNGIEGLQGFLTACRMFLALPQTLSEEAKAELEKP